MEVTAPHRKVAVTERSQPAAARFAAHDAAEQAGFGEEDTYRAGLVATELATNLVKHATGGELLVRCVRTPPAGEIEIIAIDRGPGMRDLTRAFADGHSTAGTPGTGLGAVMRLADEFDVYSQPGQGTVAACRLRARRGAPRASAFQAAGVSIPRHGETLCGDSWHVHSYDGIATAIVVDGLGHGLPAREAASAAIASSDPHVHREPLAILETMHARLRHTRGAAAAIADVQFRTGAVKYAGVGNISAVIAGDGTAKHAVSLNGTLGHEVRAFREYSYAWDREALLVMHSDGLGSRWSFDPYPGLRRRHPAVIASVLYRDFTRERDDVTVVVLREVS
jgi:anti-sigma regulatory factor (Ser/Thr protein kinase)